VFDVTVIGGGMIGASAARHLAEVGLGIAVVASPEPVDPAHHTGPFGAHYDVTRLSRTVQAGAVEGELAQRALASTASIEEFADRPVFTGPGHLFVSRPEEDEGMGEAVRSLPDGHGVEVLDGPALAGRYPAMRFQPGMVGYQESGSGACLDPRALVAAQLTAAKAAGAHVVACSAVGMSTDATCTVTLDDGTRIESRRVLLATGAFTNGSGLLERPLGMRMKTEMVLLAELAAGEAERLADLPPTHYAINDARVADVYMAPPTTYPDGSVLLKWGANTIHDRWVVEPADIANWYRNGDSDAAIPTVRPSMEDTFPGLEVLGWQTQRCVVAYTGHGMPYIDALVPGKVYLAIGGNGRSAKWADPLGALAASLVEAGEWVDPLPADRFRKLYAGEVVEWAGRELLTAR
jgi:sarcosine oxidase